MSLFHARLVLLHDVIHSERLQTRVASKLCAIGYGCVRGQRAAVGCAAERSVAKANLLRKREEENMRK